MEINALSYVLKSSGTPLPCSRILSLDDKRQLYIVAEASLEGWGIFSEEFTEAFLDSLGLRASHFEDHILADVARSAFQEALARSQADYPPWSSVQYIAAYIDQTTLRFSWIGDMYVVAWNREKTWVVNRPHLLTGIGENGETRRAILRSLQLRTSTPEETLPEVGELNHLEHPLILFFGNRNPGMLVPDSTMIQDLMAVVQLQQFQDHCRTIDNTLSRFGVRGIFVAI